METVTKHYVSNSKLQDCYKNALFRKGKAKGKGKGKEKEQKTGNEVGTAIM